jgi:hypothetical protein
MSRWLKPVFVLALSMAAGCGFKYPTEYTAPERESFGAEVFKLIRKELSLSTENADAKVEAFDARRDRFVDALDTMFPDDTLRPLHEYFVRQLPLYDDDTLPSFTRKAGALLRDVADDNDVLDVLAREDARLGYDPDAAGLLHRAAEFADLREMMMRLAGIALDRYGRDDDGAQTGEPGAFGDLLAATSRFLATVEPARDVERTPALMADFLLREDARLPAALPLYAVRRDVRRVARVATDPMTGKLYPPFVDEQPRDGLADVNASGRPVDARGQVVDAQPFGGGGPRDGFGRMLTAPGSTRTVFEYVDLRKTLLSALIPDLKTFVSKDVLQKSLRAAKALLGARASKTRDGDRYSAFSGKPLLDVAHGLFAAADSPDVPDVLAGVRALLDQSESAVAGALRELDRIDEVRERHPGGGLVAGHSFEDDLLSVVREILDSPGLLQAMLQALADPASRAMRGVFGKLLKYKKDRVTEGDVGGGRVFTTVVDRALPDRGGNKSLFQRTMQLMWETTGVGYSPEALGFIPLGFIFEIDDLAVFYLDVVAGNATVPWAVTLVTPLSERPTAREVNRFINTEQTLMSEPIDRYGRKVREGNGDTLFALEAAGGIEALRPLAKAFSDRGKTGLLVKLFVTLHLHWASKASDAQERSPSEPNYSKRSGIVTVEAFLQELFGETPFLDRQTDLIAAIARTRVGQRNLGDVLQAFARKLVRPDSALRTRDGESRVTRSSGNVVSPPSPWDLVRLGLRAMDDALDNDAPAKSAWEDTRKVLVDTLLGTEETNNSVRFTNPRAVVLTSHLLDFLAERVRKHLAANTWSRKLKEELPADLEELVTSPGLAAATDLFDAIDADETLTDLLRSFLTHMLPTDGLDGDRLLRFGAKVLHQMMDGRDFAPLAKLLSRAVHPRSGLLVAALRYFQASMAVDTGDLLRGILMRGAAAAIGGTAPLGHFSDVLGAVLRTEPGAEGPWSAEDFRRFLAELSRFMLDREKGLEKLITIVKGRR